MQRHTQAVHPNSAATRAATTTAANGNDFRLNAQLCGRIRAVAKASGQSISEVLTRLATVGLPEMESEHRRAR